ncbi:hypothetical protein GCM10010293_03090 [Streptomyces griseoflavus]|uniref:hypothetical protein n=1 Tax=Streptomyces griseoflavus TaxID=35619 RepID=UPI00167E43C3|nr:hypothetical protein [Streptomyces griseoflavus]GGV12325.1 hypothetical protein GCM10010293_03090 [Streptomyces griseoflavus]
MTAHDDTRDPSGEGQGPEYEGVDALAAALFDELPPEPARRDPAFLAARDAALADLAVLREQLTVIGDALAGPGDGVPAPLTALPSRSGDGPGHPPGSPDGTAPCPGSAGGSRATRRPRRRTAKVVLGGLVAAAAACLVLGTGWLVTRDGGAADSAARGVAADSKEAADGSAFGSPRYLACARLVAEGPVTAVEPVPGSAGVERVTLGTSRYYKGEGEVTFLRDTAGEPPLRPGDRVLVGMPPGGDHPDTVIAGEPDIAPERARIIASLPESRTLTCD